VGLGQRIKWGLRSWWFKKHLQRNQAVFDDLVLSPILASDPPQGERVLRPYLIRGLGAAGRAQAVEDHYGYFRAHLTDSAIHDVYLKGVCLAKRETPAGIVQLMLYAPTGLGREGELRMALELDGRTLHMFAMAVVMPATIGLPADGAPAFWIGCSKGPGWQEDIPDLIKRVTKAMAGLRPKALMLHAAQALATGWGLAGLYGVANEGTVFAGYAALRGRIKADYDQFWQEYEGESATPYAYRLPLAPVARDLSELPSNKRSAAARKYAAAQQWYDDVLAVATAMRKH
jgi:uncharacterized protein VirK/YbjX